MTTHRLTKRLLYYGRDEPLPEQISLRAGPLSLVYHQGDLRYVRLGNREILRRVYVAVRDRNWGTVPAFISDFKLEKSRTSFSISYKADNRQDEIHYRWSARITGDVSGTITFTMNGRALSTYLRNRIGICVLHPIRECAGQPCTITHSDERQTEGSFPLHVSPHQSFMDMRAISYEVGPVIQAEVRLFGDVFEMEDQRNWGDASYKTYCTPLRLPYPAVVREGTTISQSMILSLSGATANRVTSEAGAEIQLSLGPTAFPLPMLGLCMASHDHPLSPTEIERLKLLALSHLRVDMDLSQTDYSSTLARATLEADSIGVPIELALTVSDRAERELAGLLTNLRATRPRVCRWLIFHSKEKSTSADWVVLARKYLAAYDPAAQFVSGTNAHFAELNRGRPSLDHLDAICFSLSPQVHAFDNESLTENLEAQASILESARHFAGSVPVIVSPITLKPRFNPDATGPEPTSAAGELPFQVDPRQMSLFGAGWTIASLKHVAQGGAFSASYYETTGWRGVMETAKGSRVPSKFPSLPGSVFPVFHVIADVAGHRQAVDSYSSSPRRVDGLALRNGDGVRVLLANLTGEQQAITLYAPGNVAMVRVLDETNAEEACLSPGVFRAQEGQQVRLAEGALKVLLRPYALARIDTAVSLR